MDKLKSIYFLRGVAALAVVFQHAFRHDVAAPSGALWLQLLYDITNYGYLGVALFFVISGFCIHLLAGKVYYELVERHFLNTSPKAPAPIIEPLTMEAVAN